MPTTRSSIIGGWIRERRTVFREAHLEHARHAANRGELALGGALAEPADTALILFRGNSPDAAKAFAEKDPYVRNGLVERWEVRPWNVVVGTTLSWRTLLRARSNLKWSSFWSAAHRASPPDYLRHFNEHVLPHLRAKNGSSKPAS